MSTFTMHCNSLILQQSDNFKLVKKHVDYVTFLSQDNNFSCTLCIFWCWSIHCANFLRCMAVTKQWKASMCVVVSFYNLKLHFTNSAQCIVSQLSETQCSQTWYLSNFLHTTFWKFWKFTQKARKSQHFKPKTLHFWHCYSFNWNYIPIFVYICSLYTFSMGKHCLILPKTEWYYFNWT